MIFEYLPVWANLSAMVLGMFGLHYWASRQKDSIMAVVLSILSFSFTLLGGFFYGVLVCSIK